DQGGQAQRARGARVPGRAQRPGRGLRPAGGRGRSLMATTLKLQEGGLVTLAVGPPVDDGDPQGPHLLRLEVYGGARSAIMATAFLHPDEIARLTDELLRRLTTEQQKVIADAFFRRVLAAGAAGEK